jgi:hypothetical protein
MTDGIPRTLGETIDKRVRSFLSNVHTSMPGKVVTFYPATATTGPMADVELAVKHQVFDDDGNRTYEDYQTLQAVPVGCLRAGGYVIWLPVVAGDTVNVLFSESSIDEWRSSGQTSKPWDARRHSIGWPICVPIIAPDVMPLAVGDAAARLAGMVVGRDGQDEQIRIGPGTIQIGATATDFVALSSKVDALFTALGNVFSSWTPVATDGGAALKTLLSAPSPAGFHPATVAATLTKAK